MACSPSRVFAALMPAHYSGDTYENENEPSFCRAAKQTSFQSPRPLREIQVTGCAELCSPPDRATVTISVSNSKESVNDVTNSITRRVDYILQTLRQHEVKEGDTVVVKHIQREDDLYHMQAEVKVVFSDFERMQQVRCVLMEKLDKSVCVGAPQFTHTPECLSLLRRRVCVAAVESARLKASEVCGMLGQSLGRPLLVREEESREWGCGQQECVEAPPPLQDRVKRTLVSASSRVFVTFELQPKVRSRRKL
ncbi:interleukin-1 receptor-associated kinase 1-binding protein 1 homolog [Chanos chanos]|uniref:Interleukin-1 receptor-associated kinase 1-binding protein 1 homolog n=1 Tax=Chanos chanos TaxID=29144 RepID=A0A6J2WIL6_CHACN|nr:interleukin-1 receptor-associated kinase 1-binding protein 1 [Chanos chanos]